MSNSDLLKTKEQHRVLSEAVRSGAIGDTAELVAKVDELETTVADLTTRLEALESAQA